MQLLDVEANSLAVSTVIIIRDELFASGRAGYEIHRGEMSTRASYSTLQITILSKTHSISIAFS